MFHNNSMETSILSRVKQITSPGWMHETSAPTWCPGKTQRNQVEKEGGGGSGWGTHVNPWLIQVNVWQKPLQYCKVISLQLIKINGKKKYRETIIAKKKQKQKKESSPKKEWEKASKGCSRGLRVPRILLHHHPSHRCFFLRSSPST